MESKLDIRPSPIAGQWYPGSFQRLAESVDGYLAAAQLPSIPGRVVAVAAPHAGHIYSGPVAGYAFAALRNLKPELVAIISPMHAPYEQPFLTSAHDAYATPLGNVPIDRQTVQSLHALLQERLGFGLTAIRRDSEHSLEIELPFLQRALAGPFQLLPVMVRAIDPDVLQTFAAALSSVLAERNALLVASTDLSHFYPQPTAEKFDREMLRRVGAFDPLSVLQAEDEGKGFACGRGALAAVMWAAQALGATTATILNYATSGNVSGDYMRVVGYGSAVFSGPQA